MFLALLAGCKTLEVIDDSLPIEGDTVLYQMQPNGVFEIELDTTGTGGPVMIEISKPK